MKFGERLKNERLNQHLTQDQVSKDFFVSRQTISSWENEKTYPDINSLIKLSNYYHISLDTLLKEDHGMREYLEKKDVSYHLKPIRTSLLGMTLILSAILMCNFFNLLNLDSIINSLILILSSLTIVALNSLNKFDKNYQLSLQESWQKYLSGEKSLRGRSLLPVLFILIGLICVWISNLIGGLAIISTGIILFIVVTLKHSSCN